MKRRSIDILIAIFLLIEVVISQDPVQPTPSPQNAAELRTAGDKALNENKYDEAVKLYTQAITLDPEDYSGYYKRAAAYLIRGKNQNALSDLNKVLEKKPDFMQAKIRKGKVLVSLGRFSQAKQDFEEILKEKPDNEIAIKQLDIVRKCETFMASGESKMEGKQWREAQTDFSLFMDLVPDSVQARMNRANCYLETKDYNLVIEDTMRVLKLQSDNIDALFLRGKAFHLLGQTEAAINHLSQGLRYDPENSKCKKEFKRLKKFERTQKDAEEHFQAGRYQEALNDFTSAIEIDSDNPYFMPKLYTSQCDCYIKLKKGEEALVSCGKVLELEPGNTDATLLKGEAYLVLEKYEAAINEFQTVHHKDQGNQRAREGLQRAQRLLKMSKRKNYYQILGITKESSPNEVRKSYRKLALEWHPDKHTDKETAEAKFVEINEAYEVLSDEDKRRRYDSGEDLEEQPHFHNPFGGFGGGGGPFHFNFNFG